MIGKTFPTSSMIESIEQDQATGDLIVTFKKKGATWAYSNVPDDVVGQFLDAPSAGQFFLTMIRGQYPERKIA